jgi:hypothetical protein
MCPVFGSLISLAFPRNAGGFSELLSGSHNHVLTGGVRYDVRYHTKYDWLFKVHKHH